MYYFKFEIPRNADGTRVMYSPGWHGIMPKCPKNVTVLLYNDKEGYGIAQTDDKLIQKEVIPIDESEALGTLTEVALAKDDAEVYFGDKLDSRWDEAEVTDGR